MRELLRLRPHFPWRGHAPRYTAERVRTLMREELGTAQAERVRGQVERVGIYMHEPKLVAKYKGLENYHRRLHSILWMYLRGSSEEEIADYYSPQFTAYGVTRSLDILSAHIADRLNKDPGP